MNRNNIESFLETVAGYSGGLREGNALAASLQRHEDNMVVWIISLAAGAVIALPPLWSFISDGQSIPRWTLGLSLGPFVLATLAGIAYRLILAKIMEADRLFAFDKIHALEALRFRGFKGAEGINQLLQEVQAIMDDKPDSIARLKRTLDEFQRYGRWLCYWPYILFGVGVIGVAAIIVAGRSPGSSSTAPAWWFQFSGLGLNFLGALGVVSAQRTAPHGVQGNTVLLRSRELWWAGLILLVAGFALQVVALFIP